MRTCKACCSGFQEITEKKKSKNIKSPCNLFVIITGNTMFTCISWQDPTNDTCDVMALTTANFIKKPQFLWVSRRLQIVQKSVSERVCKLAHHSTKIMTYKPSCPEAKYVFAFLYRNQESFNSFMSWMNSSYKMKIY